MSISFRDFVIITNAFEDAQLDEGKIWDAIKKKLGGKASEEDIRSEVERLKGLDSDDMAKIKAARKKRDDAWKRAQQAASGTRPTISTQAAVNKSKMNLDNAERRGAYRADQQRALERDWVGEETLTEGQKEYKVEYEPKIGGAKRIAKIKAVDVTAVKEKFKRDFHGMKLLTVTPAKPVRKVSKIEEAKHEHMGFFQMDDLHKIEKMQLDAAKAHLNKQVDAVAAKADPANVKKARAMINSATTVKKLMFGGANFMLSHDRLKTIK